MGIGKSDAPATPDYTGAAIATANSGKYDEKTPYGSVGWTLKPGADPANPQPGDYVRSTSLSDSQQGLYDQTTANQSLVGQLASSLAGGLNLTPTSTKDTQDALYRRATQYYDQRFGDQGEDLRTRLLNQGLTEGSEAYQREMRNFDQNKNTAYADATDRALVGADTAQNNQTSRNSNAVNQLIQLLAGSRSTAPTSNSTSGTTDFSSAVGNAYQTGLAATNAQNAQTSSTVGTLGSLGAMFFSDRRLKSDIVLLGKSPNGLPAYEYTIFGKREVGHMADEVEAVYPEAVHTNADGWKMVDYDLIGGRP